MNLFSKMLLRLTLQRLPEELTLCAPSQNQPMYLNPLHIHRKGERGFKQRARIHTYHKKRAQFSLILYLLVTLVKTTTPDQEIQLNH